MTNAGQLRRAGVYVPAHVADHETWPPDVEAMVERATTLAVERVMELMRYVPPVRRETYTLADLRIVLACDSDSAVYRTLEKLKVRAYAPGKYRVKDVANAMANASVREQKAAGYLDQHGRVAA